MLKHIFKTSLFIFVISVFVGCSQNTLEVTHDIESKTTIVNMGDNKIYKVKDSKQIINKNSAASYNKMVPSINQFISSDICTSLVFKELPPLDKNRFYTSFAKADIYSQYKNFDCTTETVATLEFHDCKSKYAITYEASSPNQGFLYEKRYLFIKDKECFNAIRYIAKQDKTKVITKNIRFEGTFRTSSINDKCIQDGVIKFNLKGDSILGIIYFNGNEKMTFKGLISPNNHGYDLIAVTEDNTNITGFLNSDKSHTSGKYVGNNCVGRFTANKF